MLVDTNVIIGLFDTDDGPRHTHALAAVEEAAARGETLLVTEAILCECAWALAAVYGEHSRDIVPRLRALLGVEPFVTWDAELAGDALDIMSAEPALDIADCLLVARARRDGVSVMTMDRALGRVVERVT